MTLLTRCSRLAVWVALVLSPAAATAQGIIEYLAPQFFVSPALGKLRNLPHIDPLVDPNTFFVMANGQPKGLPLSIDSFGYGGDVNLLTYCCFAGSRGLNTRRSVVPSRVSLALDLPTIDGPLGFEPPTGSLVTASRSAAATLLITAPSSPSASDLGDFLVEVEATGTVPAANGTLPKVSTYAIFSVIPMRVDNTTASCPGLWRTLGGPTPEVLPLAAVTQRMFDLKAANPLKTTYTIAAATKNARAGWDLLISKSNRSLRSDELEIVLDNTVARGWRFPGSDVRSLWTYVSGTCTAPLVSLVADPGETQSLIVNKATASTIVLSESNNPFAGSRAVFAEPNFWTLFGGRRLTIAPIY